jgi:dynein heavy chain
MKRAIREIKAFAKPPQDVKMVMDAVCVLFGISPSWEASKKLLADTVALQKLMTYDKDNVDVSLFVLFLFSFF